MKPHGFAILVVTIVSTTLLPGFCLLLGQATNTPPSLKIPHRDGQAIQQIVEIAYTNNIPLAMILRDGALCKSSFAIAGESPLSMSDLDRQFESQFADYRLTFSRGILLLSPRKISPRTNAVLNTRLAYFRPEDTTMEGMGDYLWMYIRAFYLPDNATTISIISNPDEPRLANFRVDTPSSVRDILDLLINRTVKGLWLVSGDASTPRENHDHNPIMLFSFARPLDEIEPHLCKEDN